MGGLPPMMHIPRDWDVSKQRTKERHRNVVVSLATSLPYHFGWFRGAAE